VFGWVLSTDHDIYNTNKKSFGNINLSSLIKCVEIYYNICNGIDATDVSNSANVNRHIVSKV